METWKRRAENLRKALKAKEKGAAAKGGAQEEGNDNGNFNNEGMLQNLKETEAKVKEIEEKLAEVEDEKAALKARLFATEQASKVTGDAASQLLADKLEDAEHALASAKKRSAAAMKKVKGERDGLKQELHEARAANEELEEKLQVGVYKHYENVTGG